jgi:polar amino acid transport system permease protein
MSEPAESPQTGTHLAVDPVVGPGAEGGAGLEGAAHGTLSSAGAVPQIRRGRRRLGTWVATVVVAVLVVLVIRALITNDAFKWDVVGRYVFAPAILTGLGRTAELTVIAMVIGLVLGTVLALMRLSHNPLLSVVSWTYIWFFRSVPVLVQLIFWYNFGALYASISAKVPFGPTLFSANTNHLITPLSAAIAGLGLSQAAYTAEVIRAGILAVPQGQTRAALALGMSPSLTFRRVVLPQAMKLVIPPIGNEVISMTKNTSLVSVIALAELLYSAQLIYSRTYQTIPLLVVASLWYLAVVSVLSAGQYLLERRYRHA